MQEYVRTRAMYKVCRVFRDGSTCGKRANWTLRNLGDRPNALLPLNLCTPHKKELEAYADYNI